MRIAPNAKCQRVLVLALWLVVVVVVVTAAPTLTVGLKDTSTVVGGSLTFTCQAQGQPVPQYTWYINAQPVGGSSRFFCSTL